MQAEKNKFMMHSMKQLSIRCLWPKKGEEGSFKFYFSYILIMMLSAPFWLGLLLHLIVVLKDHLEINISVHISMLCPMLGMHFMLTMFVWGHKQFAKLFNNITDFSRFGKPKNFEKVIHRLNLHSKMYSFYCTAGVLIYLVVMQLDIPKCRRFNEEKGYNEICGLIVPFWTPYNLNYFPANYLVILIQLISLFMFLNGGAAVSFTTYEVAMVIVLQIRHFRKMLTAVFDEPCYEFRKKQIARCVKYHYHIMRLQEIFDNLYKYCNGSYIVMLGIIVAGLANLYVKEMNIGILLHLGGWLISSFFCCHAGQLIMTESEQIAMAALKSKWHEAPIDLQRDLLIVITFSQRALELHAAPIGVMSYELYITLLKTSTSYFALLRHTT